MHLCVSLGGIYVEVEWGISWFNLGNQKKKYKRYVNLKEKRDADFIVFVATPEWRNKEHGWLQDCSVQGSNFSLVKCHVHCQTNLSKSLLHKENHLLPHEDLA
jgi:hypothetical protein